MGLGEWGEAERERHRGYWRGNKGKWKEMGGGSRESKVPGLRRGKRSQTDKEWKQNNSVKLTMVGGQRTFCQLGGCPIDSRLFA